MTIDATTTIDHFASVATQGRRRNPLARVARTADVGVIVAAGGLSVAGPGNSTVDIDVAVAVQVEVEQADPVSATGSSGDVADSTDDVVSAPAVDAAESVDSQDVEAPTAPSDAGENDANDAQASTALDSADATSAAAAATPTTEEVDVVAAFGAALLESDNTTMTVEKRESAVGLASGSGVLVVPTSNGYVGLAAAFGNQTTAIGISSNNGLDWESAVLNGVPAGATASVLHEYTGTYVAMFERFNAETSTRETYVATSADAVTWEATLIPGGQVFATDMAVGSNGVVVIGDNDDPAIWAGPIGGPYQRTTSLAATALTGVTTVDEQFLVAGRTLDGLAAQRHRRNR